MQVKHLHQAPFCINVAATQRNLQSTRQHAAVFINWPWMLGEPGPVHLCNRLAAADVLVFEEGECLEAANLGLTHPAF